MNFRYKQDPIPLEWHAHWRHQFTLIWVGPENDWRARRSEATHDAREAMIRETERWGLEQFGLPDVNGLRRWYFAERLGRVYIKSGEDAFAFKLRFG
ncbi:MAG: hypothetical protein EOP83_12280 [Verrucomicrobiaceae bacterium]|nr:MAG: hypothetical protein EOP83_12280 [Verrucomicrobiaceae bacterium]